MTSELWKLKNGEGKHRVRTGEGEGGQTLWLAVEGEKSGKKDSKKNTRKSDS